MKLVICCFPDSLFYIRTDINIIPVVFRIINLEFKSQQLAHYIILFLGT